MPRRPDRPDERPVYTLDMPLADWMALPAHPRQRDVVRHAEASHWLAAATADGAIADSLRQVTAAELDGVLHKVNGHTRTWLWQAGRLPLPDTLLVVVYRVADVEELLRLYEVFDTASAAHSTADKVFGAYRQHGMVITSRRLAGGQVTHALGLALRGADYARRRPPRPLNVYKAVGVFREELLSLDALDLFPPVYPPGVLAAALIGLALRPEETEFWDLVSRRQGIRDRGRANPVQGVLDVLNEYRMGRKTAYRRHVLEISERTLRGWRAWIERKDEAPRAMFWFTNLLQRTPIEPYIAKVKALKGISDDPEL
jgi:hypothetical protein